MQGRGFDIRVNGQKLMAERIDIEYSVEGALPKYSIEGCVKDSDEFMKPKNYFTDDFKVDELVPVNIGTGAGIWSGSSTSAHPHLNLDNKVKEKKPMSKYYKVKKDNHLWKAGAILEQRSDGFYEATSDLFNVVEDTTCNISEHGEVVEAKENSAYFERVYKAKDKKRTVYVNRQRAQELALKEVEEAEE